MKLYLALCLCFPVTFTEAEKAKQALTRDQLLSKIANKHMLTGQEHSLLNIPKSQVYEAAQLSSVLEKNNDVWKKHLQDADNLHTVKDIDAIHNLDDVIYRRAFPRDWDEVFHSHHSESGLYIMQPEGSCMLVVQCYMDGCTGWIVIQRKSHNSELTWSEAWTTYKYGFGDLEGGYWLGIKFINLITKQKWYKVRINVVGAQGRHKDAEYDSFVMRDEEDFYQLKLGMYEGNAGDSLSSSRTKNMHYNMRYSGQVWNIVQMLVEGGGGRIPVMMSS